MELRREPALGRVAVGHGDEDGGDVAGDLGAFCVDGGVRGGLDDPAAVVEVDQDG